MDKRIETVTYQAALAYARAGLSVVPIRTDGTKALALKAGQRQAFEQAPADEEQIVRWFASTNRPPGIAILCGKVSGNLECIDFDLEAEVLWEEFMAMVAGEIPDLLSRVVVNKTPRPGYHLVYRIAGDVAGSQKLAARPGLDDSSRPIRECLIETRGEGGYFIAPGCPDTTHDTRRPWIHHAGLRLSQVQTITADEHALLLACARSFNRVGKPTATPNAGAGNKLRPGDDYNTRGPDWAELLDGWTLCHQRGEVRYWKRPGKNAPGCSATTGLCKGEGGVDLFHVFSSNAHPFEPDGNYAKFNVYAILHHHGDYSAAAKALGAIGYGEQRPSRSPMPSKAVRALQVLEQLSEAELTELVELMEAGK